MTSESPKRVLVFSTAYFPQVGGAEIAISEITKRLSPDYAFDLICARSDRALATEETLDAVRVFRVGIGIRVIDKVLAPFLGAFKAISLQRQGQYDLYWAMMVTYASGAAYIARWFTKVPVVLTLQEGDPPAYLRRKWFGLLALSWRAALTRSRVVTVISTYLGTLAKEFGYEGEVVLVPNGVDSLRFSGVSLVPHEGYRLVTTSRLVKKNALDVVIRALSYLPDEVTFVIYGTGPEEKNLRDLARIYGVTKRVEFRGHVDHEALPEALAAVDVFVRPSRSEGMGNSFLEAMAAGLPVIATQEGGIADFVFDADRNPDKEATGYVVDVENPEQIAAQVHAIYTDKKRAAASTERAKAMVIRDYDWNLVSKKMRAVFESLSEEIRNASHLVIATPLYPPESGGPATYAKMLAEGLPELGLRTTVVKFSSVRRLPKLIRHFAYYRRVRRAAKHASAILALDPMSVGLPAMRAAKDLNKPFYVKVVGDYAWEQGVQRFGVHASLDAFAGIIDAELPLPVRALRAIQRDVARAATRVIVPSEYLKTIVERWGVDPEKISVIRNAVSLERIGSVPEAIAHLPQPLVVSVGRLVPWKGMEGVIDAVGALRRGGEHASLAIIGDGPCYEELVTHAQAVLHEKYVLPGRLSHEDTLAVVQKADVFVLNSSYEGLSHLLIEAALLGTPIVATDAGGNSEVVRTSEEGYLVPVGDTHALAEGIRSMLATPKRVQDAQERFSPATMLTKTLEVVQP